MFVFAAGIHGHNHQSSYCKSSHPKKYLSNFPTQKNPGNENFKPPKILLSSKVPPGEL